MCGSGGRERRLNRLCPVNGELVACGEVVLVDDVYGLRVTQIVDAAGRFESLR